MGGTGAEPKMIKCDMVEEGKKWNFAIDLLLECPLMLFLLIQPWDKISSKVRNSRSLNLKEKEK